MNERDLEVLDEKEPQRRELADKGLGPALSHRILDDLYKAVATIRDRDKTIAELQREVQYLRLLSMKYGNQNDVMLSALERWASESIITPVYVDKALAQVEALNAK